MANRAKVIEGMKRCLGVVETTKEDCCEDCVYKDSPRYCQDDLMREAVEILTEKPPTHIHEERAEHEWERDDDGNIDMWAWEDPDSIHHGPGCRKCYYSFCIECDPNGWDKKPCVVDWFKCPSCGKVICKGTQFCDICGQKIDWSDIN